MKTDHLTGTLVALGSPTAYDANGQPYEQESRALVHVTEDAIRALSPNLTSQPVVILAAADYAKLQATLAVVELLCDGALINYHKRANNVIERVAYLTLHEELARALGRKEAP